MNSTRVALKLVLDEAGIPLELDRFSQRFNLQKKIYLLQLLGPDLGYRFGWYIRGPYGNMLTHDAFTLRDELAAGETDYLGFSLSEKHKKAVACAARLWAMPEDLDIAPDDWLELLASLHFLRHIVYFPGKGRREFPDAFKELVACKPRFCNSEAQARRAWARLEEFGLIASKTVR